MTRSMSRILSSLLVVALAAPVTLAHAADEPAPAAGLKASIDRAVAAATLTPPPSGAPARGPIKALPRPDRSRKQMSGGGGKTMMVVGIVGTVAGLAGTYYMIKALKNNSDAANTTAQ